MSRRKSIIPSRLELVCTIVDQPPFRSRARELVESGLDQCAAQIAELTNSLTDAAMQAMETEVSAQGGDIAVSDIAALRCAVFEGIGRNIIDRIERKLNEAIQ